MNCRVFTSVTLQIMILWIVILRSHVNRYRFFGVASIFRVQSRRLQSGYNNFLCKITLKGVSEIESLIMDIYYNGSLRVELD
jgi:hypothetical protein